MDEKLKKGVLKYCPKCGAPIKEGSLFCEKCGFDLSKRKEKAPTKFSPKMIGIIAIIAVVAVGGIYITFSGKGGSLRLQSKNRWEQLHKQQLLHLRRHRHLQRLHQLPL